MPRTAGLSTSEAKKKALEGIGTGLSVADAMKAVGRTAKTWSNWRADDPDFARQADEIRERRKRAKANANDPNLSTLDFATWRKRFLGMDTYPHQQMWVDLLEGREPSDLHPSMRYERGRADRICINTPPFHAKTATITRDYLAYKLCMNPDYRIIIVSKTQQQAKKFLYSIRSILTSPLYAELQAAYAPEGGFKPSGESGGWTQNLIYMSGRVADHKDPSVEALGIGGQIYGARADLIVLDDAVTLSNANEFEKQFTWLNQEVATRLKGGQLLVVGTRVATNDLYGYLLKGDNYMSGRSPWTYLAQPAILEWAGEVEDWKVLWPKSTVPLDENDASPDENGLYDAQGPLHLDRIRNSMKPANWSLVFMQQEVADDATFNPTCVWGSVDKRRKPGPMRVGEWGGRRGGNEGLYTIASIDPAGTGEAFVLVLGVDRHTKERWVLECFMRTGAGNIQWYQNLIEQVTVEYGVNEWVVEQNAYASWLIHDENVVRYLASRGVKMTPHYTSRNKQDPDMGVQSVAPLFGVTHRLGDNESGREVFTKESNLIHLPDPGKSPAIQQLIEQLITWQPGRLGRQLRQDGPMALWFAELRAREVLYTGAGRLNMFMLNRYRSRGQSARQMVVPQDAYQEMVAANGG